MSKTGLSAGQLKASPASNGSQSKGHGAQPSPLLPATTSATAVTATTSNVNAAFTIPATPTYPKQATSKVGSGGASLETVPSPVTTTFSSWLPKLQKSGGVTVNRSMQASHDNNDDREKPTEAAGLPTTTAESVSKEVAPFLTKHIPERYASAPPQDGTQPGGTKYCYRHRPDVKCRRQADEITMDSLQKKLEMLPKEDQQAITHMWNLFSAAPATHRTIMLQGILTQCCFPQLSFISAALRDLIRIDFLTALPPELSFKILSYLDTASLCKAAQVSQRWRVLADDDIVWHRMCEQHIDRKCDKCGWGLPLLERKRLKATKRQTQFNLQMAKATSSTSKLNIHGKRVSMDYDISESPAKRTCQQDCSDVEPDFDQLPKRRPWKDVYSERYKVESNWRRGRCTTRMFKGHTNGIICLHFDDSILATGSYDTTIKIWNLETGEEIRTLSGHTLGVRALQFDDRMLISGSMDNSLRIWNYRTGACLSTLQGHHAGVISLHFDSSLLVSGSVDNTIRVWNFAEKSCFTLRGHTDWVNSVRLHSPSRTMLSASDDMTVKIWDLDNRICIRTLRGHQGQVQVVLPFELSGRDILKFVSEEKEKESRSTTGTDVGSPSAYTNESVSTLGSPQMQSTFSPAFFDATSSSDPSAMENRESMPRYILTAALDSTVRLWDVETGRCIKTLFGHVEGIWALAADNLRVVSGAQDRMVKVWNVSEGKCERTITGHAAAVTCLALSDSRLITGSEDGEARMYCFKSIVRTTIEGNWGTGLGGNGTQYPSWSGEWTETPPEQVGVAGEGPSELNSLNEDDEADEGDNTLSYS